ELAAGVTGEGAAGIAERLAGGPAEVGAVAGLTRVAPTIPAGEAGARVEREAARLAAQRAAVRTDRAAEVVAVPGFAGIARPVAGQGRCGHQAATQIETAIRRATDRPAGVLERFAGGTLHRAVALLARIEDAVAAVWNGCRVALRGVEVARGIALELATDVATTLTRLVSDVRPVAIFEARGVDDAVATPLPFRDERQHATTPQVDRSGERAAVVLEGGGEPRGPTIAAARELRHELRA